MTEKKSNSKGGKKPRNYWLLVLSRENYMITQERGFSIQGVKSRERKKAQRMLAGDRLIFYLSDVLRFPAACTVTSEYFEEQTPIWTDPVGKDLYPYRIRLRPDVVLSEEEWIDGKQIGFRLDYVKRWTPEWWPLAFHQGQLHLLPQKDFSFLEEEMRRLLGKAPARSR